VTTAVLYPARLDALDRYLTQHVAGRTGTLANVEMAAAGRSNVTLIVTDDTGDRLVVRMPPAGHTSGNAHDVCREGRIMAALATTAVRVPVIEAICDDVQVLGTPFFVMRHVAGAVLDTAADATSVEPEARRLIGLDVARQLAALHQVEPDDVGMEWMRRSDDFVERQLRRFQHQWHGTPGTPDSDAFADVHATLVATRPDPVADTVVHGDYRLGNTIVDGDHVAAVLDWELTTLGHPTSDLAYLVNNWVGTDTDTASGTEPVTGPTAAGGFVTRDELTRAYVNAGGPLADAATLAYFRAFSYWRLASIRSGVVSRLEHSDDPGARAKADDSRRSIPLLLQAASAQLDASRPAAQSERFEGVGADAL
jgi:aminoglycoside phosphotransferase (APT) family kinase protein